MGKKSLTLPKTSGKDSQRRPKGVLKEEKETSETHMHTNQGSLKECTAHPSGSVG